MDKVRLEPPVTTRGTKAAHRFVRFGFCLAGTELAWCCCDLSDLGLPPDEPFSDEGGQASSAREVRRKTRGRGHGRPCSKFKSASGATRSVDWVVLLFVLIVICSFVLVNMRVMPGHCTGYGFAQMAYTVYACNGPS